MVPPKDTLLQNVGAIHQSVFTRPVNSLLFNESSFTKTNEFIQNLMKSFYVRDTFCCSDGFTHHLILGPLF